MIYFALYHVVVYGCKFLSKDIYFIPIQPEATCSLFTISKILLASSSRIFAGRIRDSKFLTRETTNLFRETQLSRERIGSDRISVKFSRRKKKKKKMIDSIQVRQVDALSRPRQSGPRIEDPSRRIHRILRALSQPLLARECKSTRNSMAAGD